jgi:hypothetical protein
MIPSFGTGPARAECAETADKFQARSFEVRFAGNPPALSGSGRVAAGLDSEQFRKIQVCPKDLPIRSVAG